MNPSGGRSRWKWSILFIPLLSDICESRQYLWSRAATKPAPLSIAPSKDWDGNDGPWSTFPIALGNPPQLVKVLAATSSAQTWVIATEGCVTGDPQTCPEDRGGLWDRNNSRTYLSNTANSTTDIYKLDLEEQLGYTGKGRYGFDTVQMGWTDNGVKVENQTVVGIADKSYFMGLLGLDPRKSTFRGDDKPVPSLMSTLKSQSIIPSLTWAYTAGNQYRSKNGISGSLTLGGYDRSKFTPNDVTFAIAEDERDLMVSIQKITGGGKSLLPSEMTAYLDSAVPYIVLPETACEKFEEEFKLVWDNESSLYVVSDTLHTLLLAKNPNITFNLGTPTQSVDITFPYAAFDLEAGYPLVENTTTVKYFPLRRANGSIQYTLGRTFFQEAYVIADYERRNFSISQALFNERLEADLVPVYPIAGAPKELPIGAIAGGAGAGVAVIALILAYFFWWKPRQRRRKPSELDGNSLYHPLHPNSHQKNPAFIKAELGAGDDNERHDGRYGKPVEMGAQEEIYEMDGGDVVNDIGQGDEKRRDRRWGWKRRNDVPSRQNTSDTFGFPVTPISPYPRGESSIQSTPAANYATPVPQARSKTDLPQSIYRDRTRSPSPLSYREDNDMLRRDSNADSMGFPRSQIGSMTVSSPGSSLRVPETPQSRNQNDRGSPLVSPMSSSSGRGEFRRF